MNPLEWTNALKGLVVVGANLAFQGLTIFNIWDPTDAQEAWFLSVINLIFAAYILLTYKLSPARIPDA